jgi:hypothetical protein
MNSNSIIWLCMSLFLAGAFSLMWAFLTVVAKYDVARKWGFFVLVPAALAVVHISMLPRQELKSVFERMYNPMKSIEMRGVEKVVPNERMPGAYKIITVDKKRRPTPLISLPIGFWGIVVFCPIALVLLKIREGLPNSDFECGRWWRKNVWGHSLEEGKRDIVVSKRNS